MTTFRRLAIGAPALVATVFLTAFVGPADAAEVTRIADAGFGAFAIFENTDGCIYTQMNVFVRESTTRMAGSTRDASTAELAGIRMNTCTGKPLLSFIAYRDDLPSASFVVGGGKRLLDATLVATLDGDVVESVYDEAVGYYRGVHHAVPFTLNLRWTPTGPLVRADNLKYTYKTPDLIVSYHYKDADHRWASAAGLIASSDREVDLRVESNAVVNSTGFGWSRSTSKTVEKAK